MVGTDSIADLNGSKEASSKDIALEKIVVPISGNSVFSNSINLLEPYIESLNNHLHKKGKHMTSYRDLDAIIRYLERKQGIFLKKIFFGRIIEVYYKPYETIDKGVLLGVIYNMPFNRKVELYSYGTNRENLYATERQIKHFQDAQLYFSNVVVRCN